MWEAPHLHGILQCQCMVFYNAAPSEEYSLWRILEQELQYGTLQCQCMAKSHDYISIATAMTQTEMLHDVCIMREHDRDSKLT